MSVANQIALRHFLSRACCVMLLLLLVSGCSGKSGSSSGKKADTKPAVLKKDLQNKVVAAEFVKTPLSTEQVAALGKHAELTEITFYECQEFGEEICDELIKLKQIVAMHFVRSTIDDDALARLSKLPSVAHLTLSNTKVTSKGISDLKNWKSLKRLTLGGTIKSGALEGLSNLEQLEHLEIDLGDFEAKQLSKSALPGIRILSMANTNLSDEDLSSLPAWKTLEELEFATGKITDKGVAHFKKFPALKRLALSNSKVTDAAFAELTHLKKLEELALIECLKITDGGMKTVADFPALIRLQLEKSGVTGAGLIHLAPLKSLRWVGIGDTEASKADAEKLTKLSPKCEVERIQQRPGAGD